MSAYVYLHRRRSYRQARYKKEHKTGAKWVTAMGLSKPLYNDMLALQQELVEKVQEMPEEELDKLKMDWSRALDRIALKRRKTERVVVQKGEDEVWSIEDYMKIRSSKVIRQNRTGTPSTTTMGLPAAWSLFRSERGSNDKQF